jgi:hypothetical protein
LAHKEKPGLLRVTLDSCRSWKKEQMVPEEDRRQAFFRLEISLLWVLLPQRQTDKHTDTRQIHPGLESCFCWVYLTLSGHVRKGRWGRFDHLAVIGAR